MKKFRIIILFFLIIFVSCNRDFDYSINTTKKVNVICLLRANDTVRLRLSYTLTSGVFNDNDFIKNGEVFIYENNQFKEKLTYDTFLDKYGLLGYYKTINFLPVENNTYQIKVYVPGYDTVFAETVIPDVIKIDSLTSNIYVEYDEFDGDTMFYCNIGINFKDKQNMLNYFALLPNFLFSSTDPVIQSKDNDGIFHSTAIHGEDAHKAFFSDSLFKDKNYSLFIESKIDLYGLRRVYFGKLTVDLQSLSKDAYLYYKTTYIYGKTFENPLVEPVVIYSNIKNGTGIFAGYASGTDTLFLN